MEQLTISSGASSSSHLPAQHLSSAPPSLYASSESLRETSGAMQQMPDVVPRDGAASPELIDDGRCNKKKCLIFMDTVLDIICMHLSNDYSLSSHVVRTDEMVEYDDGEIVVNLHAKEQAPSAPVIHAPLRTSASQEAVSVAAQSMSQNNVIAEFDPLIPQDWMINFNSPGGARQMPAAAAATAHAASVPMMTPRVQRNPYGAASAMSQPCLLDSLSNEFNSPHSVAKYSEKDMMQLKNSVQDQVCVCVRSEFSDPRRLKKNWKSFKTTCKPWRQNSVTRKKLEWR